MLFYDFLVIQIDGILGHLLEYDVHEKNSVDFLELARGARYWFSNTFSGCLFQVLDFFE